MKLFQIVLTIALGSFCLAAAPTTRPNVLIIVCDDLNMHLGCYGDTIVQTPNVDKLAARGLRFDRAYAQYPVCNPSRTSFLSGMHPETTGVRDQMTWLRRDKKMDVVYLPEKFKSEGYFTAGVGKVEHGTHYDVKWDFIDDFKGAGGDDDEGGNAGEAKPKKPRQRPATARVRTPTKQTGDPPYFAERMTDDNDPENTDTQIAAKTIEVLEKHKDKPLFMVAGFHKPHVPHVAPKKFFDLYPLEKMQLNNVPDGDAKDIPPAALASQKNYQPDMDEQQKRKIIRSYLACVSYVDSEIGKVLEALDRLNMSDNTIVIFMSDHGWHFGEHNWWAKASLFEESARVPLIFAGPGVPKGQVCERVVELADLYPTLCEVCDLGAMPAAQHEGKSFVPLLKDPKQSWDKVAYTALGERGRSVRNERYRYTEWNEGSAGAELYDHEKDPNEFTNLAKSPDHADVVKQMKELLERPLKVMTGSQ